MGESRSLIEEQDYKLRLVEDINQDIYHFGYAIELAKSRLRFADLLVAVAHDPDSLKDRLVEFLVAVNQSAFTHTVALHSNTFEELLSSGKLNLLKDQDLKNSLFDYYRYDESQRQYMTLQLMTEFRHFELNSGILSNEQFSFIQDNIRIATPNNMGVLDSLEYDRFEVLNSVKRFAEKKELIEWLPQLRGMQLELIEVHLGRIA